MVGAFHLAIRVIHLMPGRLTIGLSRESRIEDREILYPQSSIVD